MKKSSTNDIGCKSPGIFLIIVGLFFLFACTQPPRKGKVLHERVSEEQARPLSNLEDIQNAYAEIASELERGILDSSSFAYSCHDEKKGTISYFTARGQLRLIVHRYNEYDHYDAVDRYFVTDSMLFFVSSNSASWAFESGPEGSTRDNITERRTYLIDHQPVRCLEKKFVIRSQSIDNPSSETVPNNEVDCPPANEVMKLFQLLTKYRHKPTSGCLD